MVLFVFPGFVFEEVTLVPYIGTHTWFGQKSPLLQPLEAGSSSGAPKLAKGVARGPQPKKFSTKKAAPKAKAKKKANTVVS